MTFSSGAGTTLLYSQLKPVPHLIVNNQIKQGGEDESDLRSTAIFFEVLAVVSFLEGYNLLLVPKNCYEPAHVGAGAISLQICQEAAIIYSVIPFEGLGIREKGFPGLYYPTNAPN